jgi:hypothetical protein
MSLSLDPLRRYKVSHVYDGRSAAKCRLRLSPAILLCWIVLAIGAVLDCFVVGVIVEDQVVLRDHQIHRNGVAHGDRHQPLVGDDLNV